MDFDDNVECKKILLTSVNKLHKDYLPSEKSYFKEKHYETYAIELKEKISKKYNYDFIDEITHEIASIKKQQTDNKKLLELMLSIFLGTEIKKSDIKSSY